MSLKAIEMQVALPRTYDAGKIQEQQDQRGQLMNNHALQATLQEELKKGQVLLKGKKRGMSPITTNKTGRAQICRKGRRNAPRRSCPFLITRIKGI